MASEEEEVELRRFDNAFDAEMALEFLREHGVRARLKGTGTSGVLDRFTTVVDIRLVVPRREREAGARALEAMTLDAEEAESVAGLRDDGEVRDGAYRARPRSEDDDGPPVRDLRYRRGVIVGVAIPGGAHLYARQSVLGWMLFASVLGLFIVGGATGLLWTGPAGLMLMVYDVAHGVLAVEQHNLGRDPSPRAQALHGLVALAVASLAAVVLVTARPPKPAQKAPAPSLVPVTVR